MRRYVTIRLFTLIYLTIGVIVAATHDYVIHSLVQFLDWLLAVLFWFLVLFDVTITIHTG